MNFNTIKNNYKKGLWNEQAVKAAIKKGFITTEEFVEITGDIGLLEDSFEMLLTRKIIELKGICDDYITTGFALETSSGVEQYSLEITDQLEISNQLSKVKSGAEFVPYHANNKPCRLYTAEEMIKVAEMAELTITYHRTYFNQLKQAIFTLNNVEALVNVYYGIPLPKEYDDILISITGLSSIHEEEVVVEPEAIETEEV